MGFAPIDHQRRVAQIEQRRASAEFGCDAILLTDLTDIRWLTGFTGSLAWVAVRSDLVVLGTDGRYGDRARAETAASGVTVVAHQDRSKLHDELLVALSGTTAVALDGRSMVHRAWSDLAADVPLVDVPSPVAAARQVKDLAEVQRIEAAAASADAALADVEPMLHGAVEQPVTEADIRDDLEYHMRRHGADDRSYATIVASGPEHAARPHHEVGRRVMEAGDTVVIDVGGLVDGYHSDMTRSYVIGEPTQEQRDVYHLVDDAQRAGLDALHDGATARQVDSACRDLFAEAGYGDWYLHGTGHGVGLQIHEAPFHSQASSEVIRTGNVVTVEPGLYRVGFGGLRIEDLVLVTDDGYRCLTHHPKRPFAG